jgi:hypothetical protein
MDPATINSGGKAVLTAAQVAHQGWGWFKKWWYGSIAITSPQNRGMVHPEWVHIEGTHSKPRGTYWLVTRGEEKYWPQCRVNLHPDGKWANKINVNPNKGPRLCFLMLAWTSEFMDSIFRDYKERGKRTGDWGPLEIIKIPKREFQVVEEIVLNVVDKNPP